jgi:hypothetical protein
MERRKIVKKNKLRPKSDPKLPLILYFFNRPLLYRAFQNISTEKEIPMRKLVMSFASLGLKAYLKQTGQAFKDDELNKYL